MSLPNAERAVVDPAKVHGYLLSSTHPVGRFKAVFFRALGFRLSTWQDLHDQLLVVARGGEALELPPTAFGRRFEVRGTLVGPSGRAELIVTAWIVRSDEDFPRFITAYPE